MAGRGATAGRPAAVGQLETAVRRTLKEYGLDRLELEFRLGHRVGDRFVAGVPKDAWDRLAAALDASPRARVLATETTELLGDGARYVMPQGPTGPGPAYWLHKRRLCDFDLDAAQLVPGSPWCCRASVSLETADRPDEAPPPTDHRFRRHKRRRSYRFRCWTVDMTRVASNLHDELDSDEATYEVEIELRDRDELFERPLADVLEWGWRVVKDMCEIAGAGVGVSPAAPPAPAAAPWAPVEPGGQGARPAGQAARLAAEGQQQHQGQQRAREDRGGQFPGRPGHGWAV
jgi:hypothetical protein